MYLAAALAIAVAACDAPVTSETAPITAVVPGTERAQPIPMGRIDAPEGSPLFASDTPEGFDAYEALTQETAPVKAAAFRVLHSDASLAEKDAAARRAIATAADLSRPARWTVETDVAWPMLQLLLADPSADPGAIGFYTRVLVENGNPNADVLATAVERARPALSPTEAVQLDRQIADVAEAYLARTCKACRSDPEVAAGLEGRSADILSAVREIRADR